MHKSLLVALAALAAGATVATAQVITFTFTGIASGSGFGYAQNDVATFVFTLNPGDFSSNSFGSNFSSSVNRWGDEAVSEIPTFIDATGTGLVGDWTRPNVNENDPWSLLSTVDDDANDVFGLILGNEGDYGMGLEAGGILLRQIAINGLRIGVNFEFAGTYTDPTAYFSAYAGDYVPTTGVLQLQDYNFSTLSFTAQSLTIAYAPVPEPFATAALVGGGAFLVAALGRRRLKGRAEE